MYNSNSIGLHVFNCHLVLGSQCVGLPASALVQKESKFFLFRDDPFLEEKQTLFLKKTVLSVHICPAQYVYKYLTQFIYQEPFENGMYTSINSMSHIFDVNIALLEFLYYILRARLKIEQFTIFST